MKVSVDVKSGRMKKEWVTWKEEEKESWLSSPSHLEFNWRKEDNRNPFETAKNEEMKKEEEEWKGSRPNVVHNNSSVLVVYFLASR